MSRADDVLEVLVELTRTFTVDRPLEQVLVGITDAALDLTPGTHSSVRVLNDTRDELVSSARSGAGASSKPMTFRPGEGVVGWVAEYGRMANITDASQDKRFKVADKSQGFTIRSILAVPMILADQVIGVLAVTSPEREAFDSRHATLLQLLANCSVPVLERARRQSIAAVDEVTRAHSASTLVPQLADGVARARRQGAPVGLILFELDALHRIYAEHSFETGDHVLRRFAQRVQQLQPAEGWLVRRGGGSFGLIAPGLDQTAVTQLAEAVRLELEVRPVATPDGSLLTQTVSMGAVSLGGDETAEQLLARAEAALAAALEGGGNRVQG